MNIIIELLENIISDDHATLEASLVLLELLSSSKKLASVLRKLYFSSMIGEGCLLDSFI